LISASYLPVMSPWLPLPVDSLNFGEGRSRSLKKTSLMFGSWCCPV
jgi:hypothetical protein